jgi:hypothetical protein
VDKDNGTGAVWLLQTDKKKIIKRGRWRLALAAMAERIESERGEDGEQRKDKFPLPRNAIERAAYMFLKTCETGDVQYIKELANRLDGLPAQDIKIEDKRGLEELSDAELDAAEQAIVAIIAAQNNSSGEIEASKPESASGIRPV